MKDEFRCAADRIVPRGKIEAELRRAIASEFGLLERFTYYGLLVPLLVLYRRQEEEGSFSARVAEEMASEVQRKLALQCSNRLLHEVEEGPGVIYYGHTTMDMRELKLAAHMRAIERVESRDQFKGREAGYIYLDDGNAVYYDGLAWELTVERDVRLSGNAPLMEKVADLARRAFNACDAYEGLRDALIISDKRYVPQPGV